MDRVAGWVSEREARARSGLRGGEVVIADDMILCFFFGVLFMCDMYLFIYLFLIFDRSDGMGRSRAILIPSSPLLSVAGSQK